MRNVKVSLLLLEIKFLAFPAINSGNSLIYVMGEKSMHVLLFARLLEYFLLVLLLRKTAEQGHVH